MFFLKKKRKKERKKQKITTLNKDCYVNNQIHLTFHLRLFSNLNSEVDSKSFLIGNI